MKQYKIPLEIVVNITRLLAVFFLLNAFTSITYKSINDNSYYEVVSIIFSMIFIYVLDRFKHEVNNRLNLDMLDKSINGILVVNSIAIAINILIALDIVQLEAITSFYLILIYAESIFTLLLARKLSILFIFPYAKEFTKWTKYSAIAALTLILYPLALLLSGFALLALANLLIILNKIKKKVD